MMWNFSSFGNNTALIDDSGKKYTYSELDTAGKQLADAVGKRCLVFSFCLNSPGSVIGYTSFINHGIVPALLSAHLEKDLRKDLIETYKPSFIWAPSDMEGEFDGYEKVYSAYDYVLMKAANGSDAKLHEDLALLLTTSGSTGSPKFVRQSYENIKSNTESIIEYLNIDSSERAITTLPMNYTYGLSIINTHLMAGATIILTEKTLMQKEFWELFKKEEATSFGGVPYTYEMLDRLRFFRMDLPSLRYMTQAGGKLTPELHKKFAEHSIENGREFIVMYGQCEATARMGYLPAEYSVAKYGSMGIAIPGGKLLIIDVDGKEIEEPEVSGELVYEGPNVTLGYAECAEDLSKGDERNGRLETGDMAKRDEDGFYYIVGRKKRFLKIFGNRTNLDEVDRMIKTEFGNVDCTSGGVDDCLYIFVTDDNLVEPVKKFVVEKTGFHHSAIKVVKLDEIPKNDSGKVLYKELEKYYS